MTAQPKKNFNLPWHNSEIYGIGIFPASVSLPELLAKKLGEAGFVPVKNGMVATLRQPWAPSWAKIQALISQTKSEDQVLIALQAGHTVGAETTDRKTVHDVQTIAESLWLGDALTEDRICCYLQPVVKQPGQVFGYESFARAVSVDGAVINGERIFHAGRALGIEFLMDRYLHVEAIKTFAATGVDGFLFVNFFPGFIHRPAVYLEGLSETAKSYGIVPKHLVLEFTNADAKRDLQHMISVCEYGRSKGYSIALDDLTFSESAHALVPATKPDFVKIERALTQRVGLPEMRSVIREMVEIVHSHGGRVIAEGVEREEDYHALQQLGVDLFQGYLFAPPLPASEIVKE